MDYREQQERKFYENYIKNNPGNKSSWQQAYKRELQKNSSKIHFMGEKYENEKEMIRKGDKNDWIASDDARVWENFQKSNLSEFERKYK